MKQLIGKLYLAIQLFRLRRSARFLAKMFRFLSYIAHKHGEEKRLSSPVTLVFVILIQTYKGVNKDMEELLTHKQFKARYDAYEKICTKYPSMKGAWDKQDV